MASFGDSEFPKNRRVSHRETPKVTSTAGLVIEGPCTEKQPRADLRSRLFHASFKPSKRVSAWWGSIDIDCM